jgi:hypothetical protein
VKKNTLKSVWFRAALIPGAVGLLFSLLGPSLHATPRWIALEAIHQIENPHDLTRPGPCGELGAYQFRAATWAQHTRLPFTAALERKWSDAVAVLHYDWLCARLARNGLEPSTYNVALAWNAGIGATLRGAAPRRSHDYATRVGNLAADLHRRTMVAAR